jgi:hypothetical protein
MGIRVNAEKSLVWDFALDQMVTKTAVSVDVVGNKGTVYVSEGPIYCETGQEIFEATQLLKKRLINELVLNDQNRII